MTKDKKKAIEKNLYDYKDLNVKIENIDLEIESLLNDISCARVSYEAKGSPTNTFSSSVENEVIKRDEYLMSTINGLKKMKENTISLKHSINNSLTILNKEEYKLVELRYFQREKKTWLEIGMTLGIDKSTCHRIKNKIINNLNNCLYPAS